ncbi:MAG: hypothetical protein M0R80_03300 [Proteobacteria bacterium]|jgi:hypothetical protein|nr:hypothetical protein [Pseudomonadota bacterium]
MGASSVTGVGQGVAANLKGPGNNRSFCVPQVCPHVVAAGVGTAAANSLTVTFPDALDLAAANYVVLVTALGAGAATHNASVVTKHDTSSKFDYFTIYSEGATDEIDWVVIRTGWGIDLHHTV